MKMTSHFPFDEQVLQQLKAGLQRQKHELLQVIEKAFKEIRALANQGPLDAVDLSCGDSIKESMFAHSSQIRRQLRLVELALERIRNGEFGICAACESVIGLKRLQAIPWAKLCVECQESIEYVQRNAPIMGIYGGVPARD